VSSDPLAFVLKHEPDASANASRTPCAETAPATADASRWLAIMPTNRIAM
jgi:hypothetical protein